MEVTPDDQDDDGGDGHDDGDGNRHDDDDADYKRTHFRRRKPEEGPLSLADIHSVL